MNKPTAQEISRNNVWLMFDRIAHRYDLLNRLLSFRQDVAWRNKMARYLPAGNALDVLDVATGTGDVLVSLYKKSGRIKNAIGIDMSEKMLEAGRQKINHLKLDPIITLQSGDATALEFADNRFDVVTISFGIRNVIDVDKALTGMSRVLKPGGRALILEFSLPGSKWLKSFYLYYFRNVLPKVGGLISGDSYAYNYLNKTVEEFPYGQAFADLMQKNGFQNVQFHPLTFGIATIYQGEKVC